jgi:hypothetical protein
MIALEAESNLGDAQSRPDVTHCNMQHPTPSKCDSLFRFISSSPAKKEDLSTFRYFGYSGREAYVARRPSPFARFTRILCGAVLFLCLRFSLLQQLFNTVVYHTEEKV